MVKFPFWRLGGRGNKRLDVDRELLEKDMDSYRFVRDLYCQYNEIDWSSLSRDDRRKHGKRLKKLLVNLPNLVRKGDEQALFIQKGISASGRPEMPQEALKFLDYLQRREHVLKGDAVIKTPQYKEFKQARKKPKPPPEPVEPPEPPPEPPEHVEPPEPPPGGGGDVNVDVNVHFDEGEDCPSCYRIHGTKWKLTPTGQTDPNGNEILHCRACGQDFVRFHHRLVPRVDENCPVCGGLRKIIVSETPGAHTPRIYSFFCPNCEREKGYPNKVELSEQDYKAWKEYRKTLLATRIGSLKNSLYGKLANEYGINWDPSTQKFSGKIKTGRKTDFRNQLEDSRKLISRAGKNARTFGMANVSADEIRSDKEGKKLIDQSFIKSHELSDKDTARFSEEEQKEYESGRKDIKEKTDKEKLKEEKETEEKKYREKQEKSKARRGFGSLERLSDKMGDRAKSMILPVFLLIIGVAIATVMGNMWFMVAFVAWALNTILPDPEDTKIVENVYDDDEKRRFFAGSLLATKENRTNAGIAFMKAITKVATMFLFIWGFYAQPFPLSNLILLFLSFIFYFSMPVEFEPLKPYEFIQSFFRFVLALFIGIFIFGALGGGVFQSTELGWLSLAFLAVFPVAKERTSIERALGMLGSGTGQGYEMLDKLLFLVIMIMFAFGVGFMGGFGFTGGGFFVGTGGIIFSAVWVIGLISGLITPAETRPWMGVIILMIGFFLFSTGAGQEAFGIAVFGQWWPTVNNAMVELVTPVGEMFAQAQQTFGNTWLLFTNPVAYAQQITQGTYAQNEMGVTGAYGLEISRFELQSIYIDEPFVIQIDLLNKGIFDAKNVKVELYTPIRDFRIGRDSESLNDMEPVPDYDEYGKTWYKYIINSANSPNYGLGNVERQDAVSIFLVGLMDCNAFQSSAWQDFGAIGWHEHTVREKSIPFTVNVTYDYESSSNIQVEFISDQEWKRLSSEDSLVREQRLSTISTSPASLNLGTMDQPIKADSPFYIGFNLTNTWQSKSKIGYSEVSMYMPNDFGIPPSCTKGYGETYHDEDYFKMTFYLDTPAKYAFCTYSNGLPEDIRPKEAPRKTYTVSADAVYSYSKWKTKNTLFNFRDTCWPRQESGESE